MQKMQKSIRALMSASVLSVMATAGWSQSITWFGTLGGGFSGATGVSADGSVVVGTAAIASGWSRAFRWTPSGGMQDIACSLDTSTAGMRGTYNQCPPLNSPARVGT
jgi:probable HAF family extracellular repeat protein